MGTVGCTRKHTGVITFWDFQKITHRGTSVGGVLSHVAGVQTTCSLEIYTESSETNTTESKSRVLHLGGGMGYYIVEKY